MRPSPSSPQAISPLGGRDDDDVRAPGQRDVAHLHLVGEGEQVGVRLLPGQRGGGQRRHERLRALREHGVHRVPALLQQADELQRLVGGDAAGNDEHDAGHVVLPLSPGFRFSSGAGQRRRGAMVHG